MYVNGRWMTEYDLKKGHAAELKLPVLPDRSPAWHQAFLEALQQVLDKVKFGKPRGEYL